MICESKKPKRPQCGQIYVEGASFYLRYYDDRVHNGAVIRKRLRKLLGRPADGMTEEKARDEADSFLLAINSKRSSAKALSLVDFMEQVFLPRIAEQVRPSTIHMYKRIWHGQLKPYCVKLWMRDVETEEVQDVLDRLAKTRRFNINSMKHIKSFLSGAFGVAIRRGYYRKGCPNPVRETSLPKTRRASKTHAAALDEITRMLCLLPHPANIAVAVAAFTGARRGEIRGLRWENYQNGEIMFDRSVWQSHVTEPKTDESIGGVPAIPLLSKYLAFHRATQGDPVSGWMFPNEAGNPTCLNNLLTRDILPVLNQCRVCRQSERAHSSHPAKFDHEYIRDASLPAWHGWHSFRRGLATNLCQLGVPIKIAQAILRHADFETTANYYVKSSTPEAQAAMAKLETALGELPQGRLEEALDRSWTGNQAISATPAVN